MSEIKYTYEIKARPEYGEDLKEYFIRFIQGSEYIQKKFSEFEQHFVRKGYTVEDIQHSLKVVIDDRISDGSIRYEIYPKVTIFSTVEGVVVLSDYGFYLSHNQLTDPDFSKERNLFGVGIRKKMDETTKILQTEILKKQAEKTKAEAEKAKQATEAEIKQKEMIAWAQEHGSDRLRKGLEHGYTCKKLYETELGEYLIQDNEYEYDRDSKVEDKDRSCPSLEALEEVERIEKIEGLSASVVWLPEGLSEIHKDPEGYSESESDCEAVRIDVKGTAGYWYKTF